MPGLEPETLKSTDNIRTNLYSVLNPAMLCGIGAEPAESFGYAPVILSRHVEDEAKDVGMDVVCQNQMDASMIELDGTEDKSRLGGNAILPVSIAVAKAAASFLGLPLYRYLGGFSARHLPVPMCNVVGGGKFYSPYLACEDYLILAPGLDNFAEAIEVISMTYFTLGDILRETEGEIGTHNGIYTPRKMNNRQVFEAISKAIENAGYEGTIFLALDVCADQFYDSKDDTY